MCCFYRKKARREFCIMTAVATDIFGIPKTEPRLYQYLQKMPKDAHVIVVKNSDKLDERRDHAFIRDFMEMCEIDDLGIVPSIIKTVSSSGSLSDQKLSPMGRLQTLHICFQKLRVIRSRISNNTKTK